LGILVKGKYILIDYCTYLTTRTVSIFVTKLPRT
jgi:hypothetical protein